MSALAHHRYKLVLFGLLSVADLVLTLHLLQQGNGRVYESNPLAGWWLARLGSFGLALYKVLCVLLFGTLILTISRLNPRTGGRVLVFGCVAVAVVVCYSGCLLADTHKAAAGEDMHSARPYLPPPGSPAFGPHPPFRGPRHPMGDGFPPEALGRLASEEWPEPPGWRNDHQLSVNSMNAALWMRPSPASTQVSPLSSPREERSRSASGWGAFTRRWAPFCSR